MDTTEQEIINVFVIVHNQMGTADANLQAALKALMKKGQRILFLGHTGQTSEAIELLKNQCLPLVRHLKDDFQLLQTQKTVQKHSDSDSGYPFESMKEKLMKALAALDRESINLPLGPTYRQLFRKSFQFVRPSPPRRGPSSRRPEPRRPEVPCRGGDGRTN